MLNPEDAHYVRTYRYTGGDSSLMYQHVLSPFAQWCVDTFIPTSLAPNVITVAGLMMSFIAISLTLMFNPTLGTDGPRWLNVVVGCCLFAYQTLDNMDGKQARRTGTSSALGMFVDHGCDAINAGVSIIPVASVLGLGWSPRLLFTYSSAFVAFYLQTWEEHFSGAMILPMWNGPSDGICTCVLACFLAGAMGSQVFHEPLFELPVEYLPDEATLIAQMGCPSAQNPVFSLFSFLFASIMSVVVVTLMLHLNRVMEALKKPGCEYSFFDAAFSLFPMLVYYPSMVYYLVHSRVALPMHPVVMATLFCATFAEMVMHIMVGSICHRHLEPLSRYPAFCVVFLAGYTYFFGQVEGGENTEVVLLVVSATYGVLCLATYLSNVAKEFAQILGIYIFTLRKPNLA